MTPLCRGCEESLVPLPADRAPSVRPLARVVAAWGFGGALASAIRRLKFTGATHVARTLAPLWSPVLAAAVDEYEAVVVPVPLHWRRRLQRGFDQTWLLAEHACMHARIERPATWLRRIRASPAQSTLSAAQRAANLDGAFAVRSGVPVAGRSIILVDDVVTTGATLAAAARPLLAAGATKVVGVSVARAE